MKMKYILLSLLLVSFAPGYAQFGGLKKGLKKIKRKKKKADKKKTQAQGRLDGEPAKNDRDPISRAHESAKSKLAGIEQTVSKERWEKDYFARGRTWIEEYFKSIRKNLDKLKADATESKKPYYKKHEDKYTRLLGIYNSKIGGLKSTEKNEDNIKRYHSMVKTLAEQGINEYYRRSPDSYRPDYFKYKKSKEEYLAQQNVKPQTKRYIERIDKFYTKDVDEVCIPRVIKRLDKKHTRDFTSKDDREPKNIIKRLQGSTWEIDEWRKISASKNESLEKFAAKVSKEIKRWEEYISSGKHKAYLRKLELEAMNARRVGRPGMRSASMEGTARDILSRYGTPLRVIIASNSWTIEQNKLTGRPQLQRVYVKAALKKDGKCYLFDGYLMKKHLGGGRYGSLYMDTSRINNLGQMNCANINK